MYRQPIANFTGMLRERGTRLPMPGVMVTVFRDVEGKAEGFEATTDASGRFQFFDLPRRSGRCWWRPPATTPSAPVRP